MLFNLKGNNYSDSEAYAAIYSSLTHGTSFILTGTELTSKEEYNFEFAGSELSEDIGGKTIGKALHIFISKRNNSEILYDLRFDFYNVKDNDYVIQDKFDDHFKNLINNAIHGLYLMRKNIFGAEEKHPVKIAAFKGEGIIIGF